MKISGKPTQDEGARIVKTLLFLLLTLPGLGVPGKAQGNNPTPSGAMNPREMNPVTIAAGQKLFAATCSGCHGAHAEGGRGPNLADGTLIRRKDAQHLFGSIQKGVPGTDMPPFNLPDAQIWQLLTYIYSLSTPAAESRVPGDAETGKAIFFGRGNCSSCHMILGRGGFLGPDLSNAGMAHSWNQLKQALLDPTSRSTTGYQGITVVPTSGPPITGIVKYNTNYSVAVQDAGGNLHLLPMHEVRKLIFRKGSLMPDDYPRRLTPAEIDDVVAFLSRQSVRPIKIPTAPASPARDSK
jgi:putative heme-binding domain-containing protein